MSNINPNDYMKDGLGRLVPVENVKEIDKLRDQFVRKMVARAKKLQEELIRFKQLVYSETAAFVELSAAEYGRKYRGEKGNQKLSSYDQSQAVQVQISEDLTCDERLHIAKELIDNCLDRWTVDGKEEIRAIVTDAFSVNQKGKFNIRRILGLRRIQSDDPDWIQAMDMISDSLQVAGSKSYFRVYERSGTENKLQCITLEFSKL